MRLLEEAYKTYKEDLSIEDNPPVVDLPFKEGDLVELDGNVYVYLWKKTDYGYLGLLATPYTLLAHPSHPRVKTDGLLYDTFAILDEYLPLTEEIIKRHLTDKMEVKTDLEKLNAQIEKAIRTPKVYHPIREKFLNEEVRRTNYLLREFLAQTLREEESAAPRKKKAVILTLKRNFLSALPQTERLAAATGQLTAENKDFVIAKGEDGAYTLIVKNPELLNRKVTILFNGEPIFEGILENFTITLEVEGDISPTELAKYLKIKE